MNQDIISEITSKPILHWNARNFTELPPELLHYGSQTEEIYLRWNNIYSMPTWMGVALESLTNLYLEFNKLENLPDQMSQLMNLQTLHLDSNNFRSIPKAVFQLFNMKYLKMSRNLIESLPKDIENLCSLELLDMSYNLLRFLPPEISSCKQLREIYVNNNEILFLPKIMTRMGNLEVLDAASNQLHFLPAVPFVSRPTINISFNSKLNWCSSQAIQQNLITSDFIAPTVDLRNRCDTWIIMEVVEGAQYIETFCGGASQKLILPCGLQICNMKESKVPTLMELAQRSASKHFVPQDEAMEVDECPLVLPKEVHKSLVNGPTALCHVCLVAIFRHSYCALVHSPLVHIPHCLLIFCSRSCALFYFSS